MKDSNKKEKLGCPKPEIACYLDGELTLSELSLFESHLSECETCHQELNSQRRLICALDQALFEEKKFELPKDFTKKIVIKAESDVAGIKESHERKKAFYFCFGLVGFLGIGFSQYLFSLFSFLGAVFKKLLCLGGITTHSLHDIGIGAGVTLRALGNVFVFNSDYSKFAFFFVLIFSFYLLSRLLLKKSRT